MSTEDHPQTPNDPAEPADPKQRKRRAEHHAELLMGLANQRKQNTDETPNDPATTEPTDEELWVRATVEKYFGGEKPIHTSTLYRGVESGLYPPPINVSPNVVRWIPHECRAARQRMLSERGKPKNLQGAARRGRKRGASAAKAKTAAEIEPTA